MKIAWFTPVTGDDPIVDYSRGVLTAMADECEPVLWCDRPPLGFPITLQVVDVEAQPEARSELPSFDAVFYNLGEDYHQYGWIFEASRSMNNLVSLLLV